MKAATGYDIRAHLKATFYWRGDRTQDTSFADVTGWWRDPALLASLGPALAGLFAFAPASAGPTVVAGPDSRGSLIGPLVAVHLNVGFVEIRKNPSQLADSDEWVRRTTPPDYRDRHLELGFRRKLIGASDRVLVVDDWIDTGSQLLTVQQMIAGIGARWLGAACIVDALTNPMLRRDLDVRSLLRVRDL